MTIMSIFSYSMQVCTLHTLICKYTHGGHPTLREALVYAHVGHFWSRGGSFSQKIESANPGQLS